MHNFSLIAIELLRGYKNLLKKQLSTKEYAQKLIDLNLKKKLPTQDKDLYALLERIAKQNETPSEEDKKISRTRYSGRVYFLKHINEILASHSIEGDKVLNNSQITSHFMVEAIQLMTLLSKENRQELKDRLDFCSLQIAKYGNEEQKGNFLEHLKLHAEKEPQALMPILEKHLKNYSPLEENIENSVIA